MKILLSWNVVYSILFSFRKEMLVYPVQCNSIKLYASAFQALQQFHIEARGTMHKHGEWVQSHCIYAVESSAPTHINCELTQQLCHDQSGIFSVLFLSWDWSKISTQQTHPIRWPWTILYNVTDVPIYSSPGSRPVCLVNHLSKRPATTSFQMSA